MAIDQLALYNDALLLLGQRKLSSLTEAREPRYRLDDVYSLEAIRYCLEIAKPVFARKTSKLTSSSTSTDHDFDNVFTLPSDYVAMIEVYIDANLDRPLKRYIKENNTIACNYSTIYVRYITDGLALTSWSPAFAKVFSAYLAREAATRLAPEEIEVVDSVFKDRVATLVDLNLKEEPEKRPNKFTTTLTNDWRYIYNDALLILGLDSITTNDDDSDRRSMLDDAFNAKVVESVLEDTTWTFGLTSTKSQYDPSIEPEFGYTRVHAYPTDMHVLDGVYSDEYMRSPVKNYVDEGDYFFCDVDDIYVQYVSTDFLVNPSNWPTHFKRLIAARLAKDVVFRAYKDAGAGDKRIAVDRAEKEYSDRRREAMNVDALSAPPRRIASGNWTAARFRGVDRNRPGGRY